MLKRKNLDSEEKYKSIVEIVVSNNLKNDKIYPPVYACNTLIKINDTGIPETVGIYSDLSDKLYVKNDELSNELIQKAKIVLDTKNDFTEINENINCKQLIDILSGDQLVLNIMYENIISRVREEKTRQKRQTIIDTIENNFQTHIPVQKVTEFFNLKKGQFTSYIKAYKQNGIRLLDSKWRVTFSGVGYINGLTVAENKMYGNDEGNFVKTTTVRNKLLDVIYNEYKEISNMPGWYITYAKNPDKIKIDERTEYDLVLTKNDIVVAEEFNEAKMNRRKK